MRAIDDNFRLTLPTKHRPVADQFAGGLGGSRTAPTGCARLMTTFAWRSLGGTGPLLLPSVGACPSPPRTPRERGRFTNRPYRMRAIDDNFRLMLPAGYVCAQTTQT
jgi:hypothetical protein